MSDTQQLLEEILANPHLRKQLTAALLEDAASPPRNWWRDRARPFIAGLSSAAVVMLAFLVPSLQELSNQFATRRAVSRYAEVGRTLMNQHHYTAAEAAFDRALELAGTQRLDLIELKMQAHVQRMDEDPEWPGAVPEELTESDFLYALTIDAGPEKVHERAATLGAYGTFLAGARRWPEAEQRLREAVNLDPKSAELHVWLGNLLGDRGQWMEAEQQYRQALTLAPDDANAHYNLGLLLIETKRAALAEQQFRSYVAQRPAEPQGHLRLAEALEAQGKSAEAAAAHAEALRLDPEADLHPGESVPYESVPPVTDTTPKEP
jgi:tetratricopeptide (TPR) repeat protein